MIFQCCDERRRDAILVHPTLNGIDYLEVLDADAPSAAERQLLLWLHLLKPLGGVVFTPGQVRIEGGERVRGIKVLDVRPTASDVLQIKVDRRGDFALYHLRLLAPTGDQPPDDFDPLLSALDFSFKVECPSDFDCLPEQNCPPEPQDSPAIDYLAKDYESFRRLMLDRMALLVPQWRERNAADLGIALVELLAYVGDYLSYEQDAVATEAYLGAARRRVSLRRHTRLVDYQMHDGANARAWAQLRAGRTAVDLHAQTQLLTAVPGLPVIIDAGSPAYRDALRLGAEVFETLHPITLQPDLNTLNFYIWGNRECCLPTGATGATLDGVCPHLEKGQVLILVEQRGPLTGDPADADPAHRHAVRLTAVRHTRDLLGGQFLVPPTATSVDVTEIEWAAADALPFPLCLSSRTDAAHNKRYVEHVSVALGNIVLADHGRTLPTPEALGPVPASMLARVRGGAGARCAERAETLVPPRFRPTLREQPVTQATTVEVMHVVAGRKQVQTLPFDPDAPAANACALPLTSALPAITLLDDDGTPWTPRRDLLATAANQREYVVEVEEDGRATLRFGDDELGMRPQAGTTFSARYRVGNGARGNVGAEALAHLVNDGRSVLAGLVGVRNPLPARGGVDPESSEVVRQRAPWAFRTQARAVTPDDYARMAERYPEVQRAAATVRWTGSWRTIFLTVDRVGGREIDGPFEQKLRGFLERFRMAGHDLEIDGPQFVALELVLEVCVQPRYFNSHVKRSLLDIFSSRTQPDGMRGLFHPDNFTFGQGVYLSPLYAAAQSVPGVTSVKITRFGRKDRPGDALTTGKLELNRLEIARLDNDPNFPERGVLTINVAGGL